MSLEEYRGIIHRCFRCGYCKFTSQYTHFNCPVYHKYRRESRAPGGLLWLIRALMTKEIEITPELIKGIYSCTLCSNCVDKCPMEFNQQIVKMMIAARTHLIDKQGLPPEVRKYLMNMLQTGNPWRRPQTERGRWAEGTRVRGYKPGDDYLYYVGDIGSYHDRGMQTAGLLGAVLDQAGITFGILGAEEHSAGNDVYQMGEEDLFEYFARENIRAFAEKGVKRVCTLSPHAYNTMKNHYPSLGATFEVFHYTQVLWECVRRGRIKFNRRVDKKVTFHDPCFLGRWNHLYEPPREVLKAVPGLQLVEMERNRRDSLCCGGGGGNCYTDVLGSGPDHPAAIRIREAFAAGAEVLAVACPACLIMLEDALKTEHLENKLEVKDLSEILHEAL